MTTLHRKLLLPAWRILTLIYAFGRRMPVVIAVLLFHNLAAVLEALALIVCAALRMPVVFVYALDRFGALKSTFLKIQAGAASVRVERN